MRTAAAMTLLMLGACGRSPDARVGRDEVLLQVSATGRTDTRPDEARFTAGVETIAATAGAASSTNAAKMTGVTRAIEALGIKPDDMQTRSITLSRLDYGPNRGRFQANNLVEIRVRDLARAGAAIGAATEAGANVLSGPTLGIADPENANRSAYASAYKAARARADTYAQAAEMSVARVLAIRDGDAEGPPVSYYGNMSSVDAVSPTVASAPPVRPGMTTSEVRVHADFALKAR